MASLDWVESIKTQFGGDITSYKESAPGEPEFLVAATTAKKLVEALKNLPSGGFDHLADLTAFDEHPKENRFYVVYELISVLRKQRCSVIAALKPEEPTLPSISDLWPGANWLEREVFDMYGIFFEGHPDLRRILLPEIFKGHPLRKDFVVDYRQEFPVPLSSEGSFDPFGTTVVAGELDK